MSDAPEARLRVHLARGVAAVAVIAALVTVGWQGYRAVLAQPIARVVYAGDVDRLPKADLDALTQAVLGADHPNLEGVRNAARLVPWVRDASVRRVYPDVVEITFTTHEAVARWDERHLVSREGVVFEAQDAGALPRLPEEARATRYADLRYANGFALRKAK